MPDLMDGLMEDEGAEGVQLAYTLNPQEKNELKQVWQYFQPFFSNVLGKTDLITHHIETGLYLPIKYSIYPLNGPMKETVGSEIHEMWEGEKWVGEESRSD